MSLFNANSPADTDPVSAGASAIRGLELNLNSMLGTIFADTSGTFLTGFVTNAMLAANSVGTSNIQSGAVTLAQIPDGLLAANATGRAKMGAGFIVGEEAGANSLLSGSIQLPTGCITLASAALATGAAAPVQLANLTFKPAAMALGTYVGTSAGEVSVTDLAFEPDVILLIRAGASGTTPMNGFGIALRAEATDAGGPIAGPIHSSDNTEAVSSADSAALIWQTAGFAVLLGSAYNADGQTYFYLAIKLPTGS